MNKFAKVLIYIILFFIFFFLIFFISLNNKEYSIKENLKSLSSTKKDIDVLQKINYELIDVPHEKKNLFSIADSTFSNIGEKFENENLLIYINNTKIRNKGSYIKVKDIIKNKNKFTIYYELSSPSIENVIGEIYKKDNYVIAFPLEELEYGENNFLFVGDISLKQEKFAYTREKSFPEKEVFENINPVFSEDASKFLYMTNKSYKWQLNIFDIKEKIDKEIVDAGYFSYINEKDDKYFNFPQYSFATMDEIYFNSQYDIYKASTKVGVTYPITTNGVSRDEKSLIYSNKEDGYYYMQGVDNNYNSIYYQNKGEKYKKPVIFIEKGKLKEFSLSSDENSIVYTVYDEKDEFYSLYSYNLKNKENSLVYKNKSIFDLVSNDKYIYFISSFSKINTTNDIYRINLNGTNLKKITDFGEHRYSSLKVVSNSLFYSLIVDEGYELWVSSDKETKRLFGGNIIGDYDVSSDLEKIIYTDKDFRINIFDIQKETITEMVSPYISEEVIK